VPTIIYDEEFTTGNPSNVFTAAFRGATETSPYVDTPLTWVNQGAGADDKFIRVQFSPSTPAFYDPNHVDSGRGGLNLACVNLWSTAAGRFPIGHASLPANMEGVEVVYRMRISEAFLPPGWRIVHWYQVLLDPFLVKDGYTYVRAVNKYNVLEDVGAQLGFGGEFGSPYTNRFIEDSHWVDVKSKYTAKKGWWSGYGSANSRDGKDFAFSFPNQTVYMDAPMATVLDRTKVYPTSDGIHLLSNLKDVDPPPMAERPSLTMDISRVTITAP
jgi:hypothetical protein